MADEMVGGFLGAKQANGSWLLSNYEYMAAVVSILVVLVLIILWIVGKFKEAKDPKVQGMTPGADDLDYLGLTGMGRGGVPSQSYFGVRGDPVWGDIDSKLQAASRGVSSPSQGMMSGRGQELPMFLSSAQVNQMSQSEQAKLARSSDYEGFKTTKPLQGMSGDQTLENVLRGNIEGRNDLY